MIYESSASESILSIGSCDDGLRFFARYCFGTDVGYGTAEYAPEFQDRPDLLKAHCIIEPIKIARSSSFLIAS